MVRGIRVYVPTPKLAGGFNLLDPARIPAEKHGEAARLKTMPAWARSVALREMPQLDAIVTGCAAVTVTGKRAGKGAGYSDLEYAILRELGFDPVPVATTVHDVQVVEDFPIEPNDLPLKVICTPARTLEVANPPPAPDGIEPTQRRRPGSHAGASGAARGAAPAVRGLNGMRAAAMRLMLGWVVLAWSAAAAGAEAQPVNLPEPVVIVLSWDGVRHDYPDLTELPALTRMARDGVRAGRLVPVLPSSTFPGHVSLATGTYPDRHGIVDNHFVDRERGRYRMSSDADWIQAEPLWIAAERQGVPAATYFWVGSESDWRGRGTRYRVAPFDGDRPETEKVDRILEWLGLPAAERPRLIMSYWAGADHEGHDHGPDSRAVIRQLEEQDVQLGRLLAGIDALDAWRYTTLLVVSDHGMTEIGRYLDVAGVLEDAGIAATVTGGAVGNIYLEDPAQAERAAAAIRTLEPVDVYRGKALPDHLRLFHPERTGDVVAITEPPNSFSRPAGIAGYLRGWLHALGVSFGGHGYDPRHPDMGGVFLAMGAGVPDDLVLPEVHQVDVAPTVARLLEIEPPAASEGRPVRGIGEHLVGEDDEP